MRVADIEHPPKHTTITLRHNRKKILMDTQHGGTRSEATVVDVADSNAKVTAAGGAVAFSFPPGEGGLRAARWQFRNRDDLVRFLADTFNLPVHDGGLRGTIRRYGKYVRRDAHGNPVTAFGDPILDLITNEYGELEVGGQRLSIGAAELREPRYRMGGLSNVDLGVKADEVAAYHLRRAAMGVGDFVVTDNTDGLVAFASTNPSQRDYWLDGDHLRFKAWKKNRFLYWSMGAEVETWNHDFTSARIDSRYLDTFVGQTCAVVKVDSDSDTNDDYLDEYEWGINAPQPLRVVSLCTAQWKGRHFAAQVEAGEACFEVG
jgi:hypothetical protein